jgi:transcriptional regulator with XRE-family HTH domain
MSQILTFYIDIADNLPYTEVRRLSIMFERMKAARKALRLTQEYVARQMGMSRTTIVAIEAGKREVTATELSKFADLYGVPMEKLIHGEEAPAGRAAMFARTFAELSEADQAEIMNLMRFKKRYRESLNA